MANAGKRRADGTRASAREGYEVTAINDAWQAIEQLDEMGRRRVLEWLVAKAFNYPEYRITEPGESDFLSRIVKNLEGTLGR